MTKPKIVPPGLRRVREATAVCLKATRFVRIPQATASIPYDQPQKFNEALLAFLAWNGK